MKMKLRVQAIYVLFLAIMLAILAGCYDNDDFAPYTGYTDEICETFADVEVNSLAKIIPDANNIAEDYADNLLLTKIILSTADSGLTGDIQFFYTKVDDTKNQATSVIISLCIDRKDFYSVEFEQGHSKRVSVISDPISNIYLDMTFSELFEIDIIKNKSGDKSNSVYFVRDNITAY
jgi:hypothetical protein